MPNDIELLPCPFCGAEAVIEEIPGGYVDCTFSVGCNSKEEVNCIGFQTLSNYNTKREAAEAWNKRDPTQYERGYSNGYDDGFKAGELSEQDKRDF